MKGRKSRADGGDAKNGKSSTSGNNAATGTRSWDEDNNDSDNMRYTAKSKVIPAAEEHKNGGKAAKKHAGRKPRKSGGGVGSNAAPFSSARAGTMAKGRKALDVR